MIPKEKGTEDPTKTRPITVSSVLVRFFNKIFAKRLEEQCPVSPRQKAFRRGDGIAENVHTLQSAIRHASQQKTRADPNKKPQSLYVCFLDVSWSRRPNPAEIPACSVFPQGFGELAQARTTCSTNGSAPPTVSISMSPLLHTTGFRPGDDWLSSHRGISDYSTCLPCILVEPYMAFLVAQDTQEMDQRETR